MVHNKKKMNTQIKTDERRGSTSASNAEADALCPGRHLSQKGMPDDPGDYAETGTRVHTALAVRDPGPLSLAERETYDRCLAVEAKLKAAFFGPAMADAHRWSENPAEPEKSRLWVRFQSDAGPTKGLMLEHSCRPDCFWRLGQDALILEYKSLYGNTPVGNRNLQLRDQQVMIRGNFVILGRIGVAVIQPLVTMDPQICVYSPEDSERARQEMFARIEQSNDPASPRVAGERQCAYCRFKRRCVEYAAFAGAGVPMLANLTHVSVDAWTVEQRSFFLDRVLEAEKWLELCKTEIKNRLAAEPGFVPGWKVTEPSPVEAIKDPQIAFERFTALGGKNFMAAVTVRKTKLKELMSESTGQRGQALDKLMDAICEGNVEISQRQGQLRKIKV
jgi:hypothetical protein